MAKRSKKITIGTQFATIVTLIPKCMGWWDHKINAFYHLCHMQKEWVELVIKTLNGPSWKAGRVRKKMLADFGAWVLQKSFSSFPEGKN